MTSAVQEDARCPRARPDGRLCSACASMATVACGGGERPWAEICGAQPRTSRIATTGMSVIGFDQDGLEPFAGPGHWNDPDMLGSRQRWHESRRVHHPHESVGAARRSASCGQRSVEDDSRRLWSILTNKEVIAVDQDAKGVQGRRVAQEGPLEVWAKPLADGSVAVGLFNRGESANPVTVSFKDVGARSSVHVRDLWQHKDLGAITGSYTGDVPKHGAVLLKIQ